MSLSLSVPAWPSGKGGREKPWTYSEMPISPPRSVCPEPAKTPLAPRAHQPRTRLGGQLWRRAGWWRQGGFFWEGPGFRKRLCVEEVLQSDCRGGKMKDMKAHESKCSKPLLMTIGPYRVLVSIQYHPTYPGVNTIAGKSGLDQLPQVITPFSSSAAAVVARRVTFRSHKAVLRSCTLGACGRSTSRRSLVRSGMGQSSYPCGSKRWLGKLPI